MLEFLVTVGAVGCLIGGAIWLYNDITNPINYTAEEESTLGLVEDDEE